MFGRFGAPRRRRSSMMSIPSRSPGPDCVSRGSSSDAGARCDLAQRHGAMAVLANRVGDDPGHCHLALRIVRGEGGGHRPGGGEAAAALHRRHAIRRHGVPMILFVLILLVAFKADLFSANFWGGTGMPETALLEQGRATMLVTVFVFLGIEGASVYSRLCKKAF